MIADNETTPPPKRKRLHGACDACRKKKGMYICTSTRIIYVELSHSFPVKCMPNFSFSITLSLFYLKAIVQRCLRMGAQTVLCPIYFVPMQSLVNQRYFLLQIYSHKQSLMSKSEEERNTASVCFLIANSLQLTVKFR